MNGNPALGSYFKGRLLLSIESKQCDNPILSNREIRKPIDTKLVLKYKNIPKIDYAMRAEIHYGLNFPKNETYKIMIRWGGVKLETKPCSAGKKEVWEFYESLGSKFSFPYQTDEELPDVFIYLMKGDSIIAYIRKDAAYCMSQLVSEHANLYFFKPDKSKRPEMKDFEAGMIKMRLTVGREETLSDLKTGKWDRNISTLKKEMENKKHGYLIANVYHAQDLIPADEDGNSDPFFTFSFYGYQEQSEIINASLNPVKPFFFLLYFPNLLTKI
jgi:hypothetical protein